MLSFHVFIILLTAYFSLFVLLQWIFLDGDGDADVVLFCCMGSLNVFCSPVFLQVVVFSMVLVVI